ncbi:MAG: L-threonylcarbamoyladenylate synthase [Aquabacterium sp.]
MQDPTALDEAVRALVAGRVVAFPTETVYGLGARADDDAAVGRIFAEKRRPADHPLIVHVPSLDAARGFAARITPVAEALATAFWPGPVSLVLDRRPGMADAAAGGASTIALRCPAHPVARALLERAAAAGVAGVAAPSANRFGRVSPTTAAHVASEFGPDLLILDGGACPVGIESAIVDCRGSAPVLLRPGSVSSQRLAEAAGQALAAPSQDRPRVSGDLASHYAPDAPVRLMPAELLRQSLQVAAAAVPGLAVYSRTVPLAGAGPLARAMPGDPAAAAHELFAALRDFDARGARLIWVEEPPDGSDWDGVRDRLRRAAAT